MRPWFPHPVAALMGLVVATSAAAVRAATFTVDRFDDVATATACVDAVPNDCSLRGAVSRANAAPDHDVVILPAGTYEIGNASPCTFHARRGESFFGSTVALCLDSDVTIRGAGSDRTVIRGNGMDRVIAASVARTFAISGVTVTHGGISPFGFRIGGGSGILNHGTMVLSDSAVSANNAGNGGGGGIFNFGTLTLVRTVVADNASSGVGGGIFNSGDAGLGVLNVQQSTLSGNTASQPGAGLGNMFGGKVTVADSTVSGNATTNGGGGIYNSSFSFVDVTNSTISDNRADSGGGVTNQGTVHLRNVNLVGNVVGTISNRRGVGGGINNVGTVTLRNTIIAGNVTYYIAPDCMSFERDADFTSLGHNLIQNTANCDISGDTTGNILGQDPQLGLLADNGGFTRTHAPAAGSPVVDAGSPAAPGSGAGSACAATDQRGYLRPLGSACDMGAFERSGNFAVTRVLPRAGGNAGSVSTTISGSSLAGAVTVKLTRAGEADVVASPVTVDLGGSAIAATFDLAGRPVGPWNVVVVKGDGATTTLVDGFTVETARAPQLWVEVVGRFFRPGRPSRLTILYGNRGNVDALAVPFSLSVPEGYAPRRIFALAPPPAQPGQVREDFTQVPVTVDIRGENGHFTQIPLLLPVVPAGFSGSMQIGLTLPPGAQDNLLVASIGNPLYNPGLDPQAVDDAVAGARAYLQEAGVAVPPALVPELVQYATNQFERLVASGRAAMVDSLGTVPEVYSMSQLRLDLALYAADRAASLSATSTSLLAPIEWIATGSLRALAEHPAVSDAKRQVAALLGWLHRSALLLLSWLGPAEAYAQQVNCPVARKGATLAEGCSGGGGPDEPFLPPEIPPPPGCNLSDPSTFKNCKPTPDHCDALPGYKVVKASNGAPFCVPKQPQNNCSKLAANPMGSNQGCSIFPLRPKESMDPNDKVGSMGAAAAQFLIDATPLGYTIFFENLASATAAAQEVVISDQLDSAALDLDTFSLGPISFGPDITLVPPPGTQHYSGGVDLRPAQNLIVTVAAGLDKATGLLTWRFASIDPGTGQLTEDPDAGFLPPNANPPEGEGSVAFAVRPKAEGTSLATLCNQASIVFDVNAPIVTPQWCNSIDGARPASTVSPLAATQAAPEFLVEWSGSDAGSGLSDYTILVSTNGGAFVPFLTDTSLTSAVFTGATGSSYAFYSLARDQAGNLELPPAAPDATTTVIDPLLPTLVGVASRKVHGSAGTFDLPLNLISTNPTTEPRSGGAGGNHTIVFVFDKPVTAGNASVIAGVGTAGTPNFSGTAMIVPLSGATNQQYVTVSVSDVVSADGGAGGSGSVRVGFLLGDVSQNRVVTVSDLAQVNAQIAQVVTPSNYLKDVNASGTLTVADKGIANTQITKALPAP
jgi:hypothetical protein